MVSDVTTASSCVINVSKNSNSVVTDRIYVAVYRNTIKLHTIKVLTDGINVFCNSIKVGGDSIYVSYYGISVFPNADIVLMNSNSVIFTLLLISSTLSRSSHTLFFAEMRSISVNFATTTVVKGIY